MTLLKGKMQMKYFTNSIKTNIFKKKNEVDRPLIVQDQFVN